MTQHPYKPDMKLIARSLIPLVLTTTLARPESRDATLLQIYQITVAGSRCGYVVDAPKLDTLMRSVGIVPRDLEDAEKMKSIATGIDDTLKAFYFDKQKACAEAFADYGVAGDLGRILSK